MKMSEGTTVTAMMFTKNAFRMLESETHAGTTATRSFTRYIPKYGYSCRDRARRNELAWKRSCHPAAASASPSMRLLVSLYTSLRGSGCTRVRLEWEEDGLTNMGSSVPR